jgi:hypothetical protein
VQRSDIDGLLIKLPVRMQWDLRLHHELLCAREAVLCMEDTRTVSGRAVLVYEGRRVGGGHETVWAQ